MKKFARRYPIFFEQVIDILMQADDAATALRLHSLVLPSPDQPQKAWVSFANGLRTTMREERDIGHNWQINDEQWNKLNAYFPPTSS